MSESTYWGALQRIRNHTREGSAADKTTAPSTTEMLKVVSTTGEHAVVVFVQKYGRESERGTLRTVLLVDNGNQYELVNETRSATATVEAPSLIKQDEERARLDRAHDIAVRELGTIDDQLASVDRARNELECKRSDAYKRYVEAAEALRALDNE